MGERIGDHGHGNSAREQELARRLEAVAERDAPEAILRTLADVAGERRLKPRDCRDCKNFERDESGLNYGWCNAHEQYVKLYHPAGNWFSQCLFKGIRRFKAQEFERARILASERAAAVAQRPELDELPQVVGEH